VAVGEEMALSSCSQPPTHRDAGAPLAKSSVAVQIGLAQTATELGLCWAALLLRGTATSGGELLSHHASAEGWKRITGRQ